MSYKQTGTFAQRQPENPARHISDNLKEQPVVEAEQLSKYEADTFLTEPYSNSPDIKEDTVVSASQVQPNRASKVRSCSKCIKIRQKTNKNMCKKCYRRKSKQLHKECQKCGKLKRVNSSCLCKLCSLKKECLECKELDLICIHNGFKSGKMCQKCKQDKPILACGVCRSCYNRHFIGSQRRHPKVPEACQTNNIINNECKEYKTTGYILSFGSCTSCYLKSLDQLIDSVKNMCRYCKEPIVKDGLCKSCSDKVQTSKTKTVCKNCGNKEKSIRAREMCGQCYFRIRRSELRAARQVNSAKSVQGTRTDQSTTKTICAKCKLTRPSSS